MLASVCVGARLCWTGPSDVALPDSKWQKREKERKGKRQGRKRECLDKLTEQICRYHLMFFKTISYCKFLPPSNTHTFSSTQTTSQPKSGENCCLHLLCLPVSPLEIPLTGVIKEGKGHASCRMDDAIAPSVCGTSLTDQICRSDPCRSDCQDWVYLSAFL